MSDYKRLETQRLGNESPGNDIIFNMSILGTGTLPWPSTMSMKDSLANPSLGGLRSSPRSTECGSHILTDPEPACSGNKYTLEAIWKTTVDLWTHPIFTALAIVCSHLV